MAGLRYITSEDASLTFGSASQQALNFMQSSLARFQEAVIPQAQYLAASAYAKYDDLTKGETYRRIESIKNAIVSIVQTDTIRYLSTAGEIQFAPDSQVRFIMACPEVRQLYQDGRIDGYGDRYTDFNPGTIAATHYDYRVTTANIIMPTVVDEVQKYFVSDYTESRIEETPIGFSSKVSNIRTWNAIVRALEEDIDVTSSSNELIN